MEKWIENTKKQADDFLAHFVQAFDKTTTLIFKIQYLEGVWEEFRPIQEKTIPRLRALKKVPMSTLIRENIVHNGDRYDFHGWYCSLTMKKSTYEHAQKDCAEIEESIHKIQLTILASIEELLGVDVSEASGLHLVELRDKKKFAYFNQLDSLKKSQMDNLVSLLIHVHNSHKLYKIGRALWMLIQIPWT